MTRGEKSVQGCQWEYETLDECPLCAGRSAVTVFDREIRAFPVKFVRCQRCDLVFQNPRMTREGLEAYFSSSVFIKDADSAEFDLQDTLGYPDYFDWDPSYRRTADLRLAHIRRFKAPPARLLEIGTATGSFLDQARRAGYDVRGLDVSETFAAIARKQGLEIDEGFVEEFDLPEAHYDVICNFGGIACWRDPLRGLRNVRRALKPDGVFVLNHPNVDALVPRLLGRNYFEFNPASLQVFSDKTLDHCLEKAGLAPVVSRTERQYASVGRIVTYLKSGIGVNIARRLRLDGVTVPVIAFGTTFKICRPRG